MLYIVQYLCNHFSTEYNPTGDEYLKMDTVDGSDCIVEVHEISSAPMTYSQLFELHLPGQIGSWQMANSQLFELYARSAEAFVLVYSVVERVSFERVRTLMADIQNVNESKEPVHVVLVGNKIDSAAPREVSTEEGVALARALGVSLVEVSAKESSHVDEAFHLAVRLIKRQQEAFKETQHISAVAIGDTAVRKAHGRCEI
ncbi:Ras GTPase ras2 [Xylographa trunciseda]|nr:Ras GTPase ras2 [Xylographa trunciseda]